MTAPSPDPSPIPIVLAIDVEPDGRPTARREPIELAGFDRTVEAFDDLRLRFAAATGRSVRFAWFVRTDAEIATRAGDAAAILRARLPTFDRLRAGGDRIGVHTHLTRWDANRDEWLVDHGDPAFVVTTIERALDAYASVLGEPCREHRFGDRWSSAAAVRTLAERGVEVDLTIEPGQRGTTRADPTKAATGRIPSYEHERSEPRRFESTSMWQVPLSSDDPGPTLPRHLRLARRVRYVGRPLHRPLLLDRAWPGPTAFWDLVERHLATLTVPYMAFAIRSDLILQPRWAGAERILAELVVRGLAQRLRFTDGHGVIPV